MAQTQRGGDPGHRRSPGMDDSRAGLGGDGRGGSPASTGVPGNRADLPTGRGGHRRSGPAGPSRPRLLETGRRRRNRTRGPGAADLWAAAGICPPRLPGRAVSEEVGVLGGDLPPALRWSGAGSPLRAEGPRAGMGEVASEKETSEPQRAEGRAETDATPGGPRQPSRLLCPSLRRKPFRSTGSRRPRAPLPWCCLGCGPGAPEPSAGPAPHVGSRLSPPRGLQRAGSPAGRAQGTSLRGDREGRAGTLDIRRSQ